MFRVLVDEEDLRVLTSGLLVTVGLGVVTE